MLLFVSKLQKAYMKKVRPYHTHPSGINDLTKLLYIQQLSNAIIYTMHANPMLISSDLYRFDIDTNRRS